MTKPTAASSKTAATSAAAKPARAGKAADKVSDAAAAPARKASSPRPAAPATPPSAAKPAAKPSSKTASAAFSAQADATKAEADVTAAPASPRPSPKKISTAADNMPSTATKVDPKLANAWKNKAGRDLSEAELLAMPDSEYMNDKQLDFFRGQLETQKEDLLSNAGETTEHLREDTSIVPDPADRATIEEEHALELRTRDRERKLLKKISQALVRIDSGEYGFCDETGEPIGLGRLLARPTATLSLEAQQRRELKQKMFGD
ncbi:MAG: RNA polymerase-binding protein DksA [Proteobacteria bacterium]|nr:RNA polymerase-binding protein DksA [Pseudomonadota bacterium]